ncbi:type II and III secretion system protein family protein [candidate division CSSED10-310 bacterium]|uniref:Type II and III secretion system protein family protein n=1 Tax=candidate division CSSED10-310 bacterium TaxID=2855610 RepID=A0ABV6YXS0_UNCC1
MKNYHRLMAVVFVLFTILSTTTTLFAQTDTTITLILGEQKSIDVRNVKSVAIGDSTIADVKVVQESNEMLITGLSAGLTTLTIWDRAGRKEIMNIRVIARDPNEIAKEVKALVGDIEGIIVRVVGDQVVLDGEVFRLKDMKRAETIAKLYKQVVNLLEFNKSYIQMSRMIQLEYNFYEISKGSSLSLGINWSTLLSAGAEPLHMEAEYQYPIAEAPDVVDFNQEVEPFGRITVLANWQPLSLDQGDNRARRLESHRVVVRSGEEASYVAGGEIPLIAIGLGTAKIEYKEYGFVIKMKPEIDKINNVIIGMDAVASKLDWSNSIGGIPGIIKKHAQTIINMRAGQTLALAGFLSSESTKSANGLPLFSKIPILGYLFGSKDFVQGKSDAVVFITPTVVDAVENRGDSETIKAVLDKFERPDRKW